MLLPVWNRKPKFTSWIFASVCDQTLKFPNGSLRAIYLWRRHSPHGFWRQFCNRTPASTQRHSPSVSYWKSTCTFAKRTPKSMRWMSASDLGALLGEGGSHMGRVFSIEMFLFPVYWGCRTPPRATVGAGPRPRHRHTSTMSPPWRRPQMPAWPFMLPAQCHGPLWWTTPAGATAGSGDFRYVKELSYKNLF